MSSRGFQKMSAQQRRWAAPAIAAAKRRGLTVEECQDDISGHARWCVTADGADGAVLAQLANVQELQDWLREHARDPDRRT